MASATIILEVRSTQLTIRSLPDFERGMGPIMSIAQWLKGSSSTVAKDSTPNRACDELLAALHAGHVRTK